MLEPKNPMTGIHVGTIYPAAYGRCLHREQVQATSCSSKHLSHPQPTIQMHTGETPWAAWTMFWKLLPRLQIFCFLHFLNLTLRKSFSMRHPLPTSLSLHSSPLQMQSGRAPGLEARMSSHGAGEVGNTWFLAFDTRFLETNFTIT